MAKENVISSIDVGSSKISTLISFLVDGKINVTGTSGPSLSKGVGKGSIINIDEVVRSIQKSVDRAERMSTHPITLLLQLQTKAVRLQDRTLTGF